MTQIYLSNIHCHEETNELSSADEPSWQVFQYRSQLLMLLDTAHSKM
jgi:hypothetical protein